MDNQQAKFILECYRPDGQDAIDPHFAEALQQAERDPDLANWFAAERALDAAIAGKIKQAPVPADLRAAILDSQNIGTPNKPRRNVLFALAAAIVLLGVLAATFWLKPSAANNFAACRNELVGSISTPFELDYKSDKLTEVRQWLRNQESLPDFVVPAGLGLLPSIGCRTLRWEGKPIALICFLVKGNEAVHLFLISRSALPNAPTNSEPEFVQVGEWLTASWSQGELVYLFAGQGDEAALRKYLSL